MTNEEILREIASLPANARRQVEDFVVFLTSRHKRAGTTPAPVESDDFIGIWSDRDDLTDSTSFVRSLREKHWAN